MSPAGRRTALAAALPGRRRTRRWAGLVLAAAALVTVAACGDSGSLLVPEPTAVQRADTVSILQRAKQDQGICYGWRLMDKVRDDISVGSNLGDGVSVNDPQRCPVWVEVSAVVSYYSENSSSEDRVNLDVDSSDGLHPRPSFLGLERFGLDHNAFLDDPGWAITRAATVLPLLTAEAGAAEPAPVRTDAPAATVQALPDAGSDYWRDRWGFFLGAVGVLLLALLLLIAGLVNRLRS